MTLARITKAVVSVLKRHRVVVIVAAVAVAVAVPSLGFATSAFRTSTPPPDVPAQPSDVVVAGPVTEHGVAMIGGVRWWLDTFHNPEGQLCVREHVPGGTGQGCFDASRLFSDGPIALSYGSNVDPKAPQALANVWVWGFADDNVAAVELVSSSCTTARLSLDASGVFFHVIGGGNVPTSSWPLYVKGFASNGTLLASKKIDLGTAFDNSRVAKPAASSCS